MESCRDDTVEQIYDKLAAGERLHLPDHIDALRATEDYAKPENQVPQGPAQRRQKRPTPGA